MTKFLEARKNSTPNYKRIGTQNIRISNLEQSYCWTPYEGYPSVRISSSLIMFTSDQIEEVMICEHS